MKILYDKDKKKVLIDGENDILLSKRDGYLLTIDGFVGEEVFITNIEWCNTNVLDYADKLKLSNKVLNMIFDYPFDNTSNGPKGPKGPSCYEDIVKKALKFYKLEDKEVISIADMYNIFDFIIIREMNRDILSTLTMRELYSILKEDLKYNLEFKNERRF